MLKTAKSETIFRETRFRIPSPLEHAVGMWIDRVGRATDCPGRSLSARMRLLGQYALVRIEEGEGRLQIAGGKSFPLAAGDAFFLFPEIPASYGPEKNPWTTEWVVWNCGNAPNHFAECLPVPPAMPVLRRAGDRAARGIAQIRRLMVHENRQGALQRAAHILAMLADLAGGETLDPAQRTARRDPIAQAIAGIEKCYGEGLSVTMLAAQAGMGVGAFRQAFKARTGHPPKKHIQAVRLARAKEMLADGATIKETAAACGFGDVFHFMHAFKAATGLAAGRFKNRIFE